jgi:ribosomal protein L7/L12
MTHESIAINVLLDRLVSELAAHQRERDEGNRLRDEVYACQEHIGKLMTQIADLKNDLVAVNGYLTSSQNEVAELREELRIRNGESSGKHIHTIHIPDVQDLISAIMGAEKLKAIKLIRKLCNMTLTEAKSLYENAVANI